MIILCPTQIFDHGIRVAFSSPACSYFPQFLYLKLKKQHNSLLKPHLFLQRIQCIYFSFNIFFHIKLLQSLNSLSQNQWVSILNEEVRDTEAINMVNGRHLKYFETPGCVNPLKIFPRPQIHSSKFYNQHLVPGNWTFDTLTDNSISRLCACTY